VTTKAPAVKATTAAVKTSGAQQSVGGLIAVSFAAAITAAMH